ncbi:MAG: flagellar basal body rod protein FlgC [bacterium]|nr:flagellar basal body rod protein FlgC [bacterium]
MTIPKSPLASAQALAANGMDAYTKRLETATRNMANAQSTATTPGGKPYQRQVVTFKEKMDRDLGQKTVKANKPVKDKSAFRAEYKPGHPAADENGYVLMPNADPMVEMMDVMESRNGHKRLANAYKMATTMRHTELKLMG